MDTREEYLALLAGQTRTVDVAVIEHELTQLWKAAGEAHGGGQPMVRACVLNLIAFAPNPDAASHMYKVIAQTSGRHPSRSIVIVVEPDGEPGLRASISAHCQIPVEGGKQVCSEQISLHASGPAVDELHGTVLQLLVPDLPAVLWWHDEPSLECHLFRELLDICDQTVVDSADFEPERAAPALVTLERLRQVEDVAVSDLNWARLTPWRELIAQFFDVPPGRDYLDRLDRVEVEIASLHGRYPDFTEGLLLLGWLASRLGWTLESSRRARDGAVALDTRGPSGNVAVHLKPDPEHPGEGLHSIRLGSMGVASFLVTRESEGENCVAVAAEMPEGGHHRVVHMDPPSEAVLLCEQLEVMGRDAIFEEALSQATRFMIGGL